PGAPEARRRRSLSPREDRQGHRRADGARRRAGDAPSPARPEGARRQALRQDPGHHRAAARRQRLHRRHPARRAEAMSLRAALAGLALLALPLAAAAEAAALAIVIRDRAALRAAPRAAAPANALLWQGETLEVRGERLDYLQVYDYRRERGGFVLASEVQRISPGPEEAPELLSIVRFLRRMPGAEALGIGFAAAYIEAAPAEVLASEVGVEALDALAGFIERHAGALGTGEARGPSRRGGALRSRFHPPRAQRPGLLLLRRRGLPQG